MDKLNQRYFDSPHYIMNTSECGQTPINDYCIALGGEDFLYTNFTVEPNIVLTVDILTLGILEES